MNVGGVPIKVWPVLAELKMEITRSAGNRSFFFSFLFGMCLRGSEERETTQQASVPANK